MKINFKKLNIQNFLSIGYGEITLENKGYTLIEGINNNVNDNATSNGSGKSSIFNALCFALTGETIQGISSNLKNIYNEGDMRVELNFSIDNDNYKIIRGRDNKDKPFLYLYINDENKSGKTLRESEEQLKKYLPFMTSELLGEVIIVGQGMPHKFSNNTPSGRKEILEKLSNNDVMLYDIKERVEKRLNELLTKKQELNITKTQLDTQYSLYTRQKEENEKKIEQLNSESSIDYDKEIISCENRIKELEKEKEELNKQYLTDEENYELDNASLINMIGRENKELEEEEKIYKEAHDPITKQLFEVKATLDSLNREITRKENIKDVCPTCGQKLQGVHKPDLTEDYKKRDKLKEQYTSLKEKSDNQENAFKLNIADIKNNYKKEIEEFKKEIDLKKTKLVALKRTIDDYTLIDVEKKRLNDLTLSKNSFKLKLEEANKALENLKVTLEKLSSDQLYNIKEIDNLQEHLDVVNKINTYVKRDFRGILLSNVISYINLKCKEYAKEIFGNDDIEFTLNGNNIDIRYSNKLLDTLSGGEQQKVDLIIQFAIRSMMQEYTGFNSNIIVLDEILDQLDSRGCDEIINFITNRLSDIESIFIISHHADSLNICNDSTIKVIKNSEGVSYISEE